MASSLVNRLSKASSSVNMASSLIASINSALHYLDTMINQDGLMFDLKMGLRNLKALLIICFRKSGDVHIMASSSTLQSLLSRIQDAIEKVFLPEIPIPGKLCFPCQDRRWDTAHELHCIGKQLDEEWCSNTSGPLLTMDDAIGIADSTVANCFDFLSWVVQNSFPDKVEVKVIDGFQQQIQFLRNFLVFANHTGVPVLHDILNLVQPIAINAARVFFKDGCTASEWIKQVQSKCSRVNGEVNETRIYDAYAQALNTSTTGLQNAGMNDDILIDFLDSLKSLLWDVLRHSDSRQDPFIATYESLRTCRAILKQEHPISFDGKIKGQIGGWIRDTGSFICSLRHTHVQKDVGRISDLLRGFDAIQAQFQNTPSQSNGVLVGDHSTNINICHSDDEEDLKVSAESQMSSHQPPQTTIPQVVGFQDDEVQTVLDQLIWGSNQLRILPIYGMAGIGKTTFALKLYNHRSTYQFQARAWCTISQELDKTKVWVQLLNQIDEAGSYSGMTDNDLANTLRRRLKRKRYLILLDDVWTLDVWNSLKMSFPDDSTRSRIILTSRNTNVSPHGPLCGEPYCLRLRKDPECFEILKMKMKLSCEEGWNTITGMEIAKLCMGLPLVVVVVAGLLATVKQQDWMGVLYRLSSGGVTLEEQCNKALELSFMHLPDDLKLCFIYTGAFPKGKQVSAKKLIRLWIAEGFIKKNGLKTSEDVGREYLLNLIRRSLAMVAESRSIGGVKSFWIHDILHDFCERKARQESSFHSLNGHDQLSDFNPPLCLQRLCIHSLPIHFKNSKLFCPSAQSLLFFSTKSHSHSIFDMSFIIQISKLVKVLDMEKFLVAKIPSEIEFLSRLIYLSVQTHCPIVPFSIGNLSELETLIIDPHTPSEAISFPDTFWNLQKLKYLQFQLFSGYKLSIENSCNMLELESLSGVTFSSHSIMEKQLRKFPNISRLKCRIAENPVKVSRIVVPDNLNQLRSLSVSGTGNLQCEFRTTQNLRKLTLQGFELCKVEIAVIGKLPHLEVLKLVRVSFPGKTLEMKEGDFSKLEIFHLSSYLLKKWKTSDEQLPNLRKLVLHDCIELVEIPSKFLKNSPTLEEIEVKYCSSALISLVRDIEKEHKDFGNFIKVFIHSHQYRLVTRYP